MPPASPTKSIGGGHKRTASSILKSLVGHRKQHSISELTDLARAAQPPVLPALDLNFELAPPRAPFMGDYTFDNNGDLSMKAQSAANTPRSERGSFDFFTRPSIDGGSRKSMQQERGTEKKSHKTKSSIDFTILRQRKDKDKSKTPPSPSKLQKDSKNSLKEAFNLRGTNKENTPPAMKSSTSQPQLPTIPLSTNYNLPFIPLPSNHPHSRRGQNPAPVERPSMLIRPKSYQAPSGMQSVQDEISRYTPAAYTPSKQRDFGVHGPELKQRPKSVYTTSATPSPFGSLVGRTGGSAGARASMDVGRTLMGPPPLPPPKDDRPKTAKSRIVELEGRELDDAFERVLEARDIPHNLRAKMRTLDNRVKNEFIANEQILEVTAQAKPAPVVAKSVPNSPSKKSLFKRKSYQQPSSEDLVAQAQKEENRKSLSPGKRLRPRSGTFGSKEKKLVEVLKGGESPSKKKKHDALSVNTALQPAAVLFNSGEASPLAKTKISAEVFVEFLRISALGPAGKEVDTGMKDVKLESLHKLRLVLRNERLKWVEKFLDQGGMELLVDVLNRCMRIEWREEHEDKVMHEILLCLKALTTSNAALVTLDGLAPTLFPSLIDMIFDKEHKGPSEYNTREVVFSLIYAHLSTSEPAKRYARAQRVLSYLSDKRDDKAPEFITQMYRPRPYKTWFTEVYNVTKEVFWIFIHQQNVLAPPERRTSYVSSDATAYFDAHCPIERLPVPSAPYVGGVEFEAANYIATHLDLMNLIIACVPDVHRRNDLRSEIKASGWEKVMGVALRTCKEKLYGGVHAALKTWIDAAGADGWDTDFVRMGGPREVPRKKAHQPAPQIELKGFDGAGNKGGAVVPWDF